MKIGILATTGTAAAGIYADRLTSAGLSPLTLSTRMQENTVMTGIRAVKAGHDVLGSTLLGEAADTLLARGAERIILACTEIPPALARANRLGPLYVDATQALAENCVAWSQGVASDAAVIAA